MTSNTAPMGKEELRRIAEEATRGPWRVSDFERLSGGENRVLMGDDNYMLGYVTGRSEQEHDRDARFIATFNPSRVLEMMDREAELEREIASLKASREAVVEHAASAAATSTHCKSEEG